MRIRTKPICVSQYYVYRKITENPMPSFWGFHSSFGILHPLRSPKQGSRVHRRFAGQALVAKGGAIGNLVSMTAWSWSMELVESDLN